MPIYEFKCPQGTVTEKLVPLGTLEIRCPKSHRKAKKILSQCKFVLKGGGWYVDGYASRKEKPNGHKPG